jgi:hypothetical protein
MLEHGHLSGENIQGLEEIKQQLQSLRRENHFLKLGLAVCFVLLIALSFAHFQSKTSPIHTRVSAKKVITEVVEFLKDGKTVMSIAPSREGEGLIIWDKNGSPMVWFDRDENGGIVGVYNKDGKVVASMECIPIGGLVRVYDKDGEVVAVMDSGKYGGRVGVFAKGGKFSLVAEMRSDEYGGAVSVGDKDREYWTASMHNGKDGGVVGVYDPKDGKSYAQMFNGKYGGIVSVFAKGGKFAVAEMRSDKDGGTVGVGNKDGEYWTASMHNGKDGGVVGVYDPKDGKVIAWIGSTKIGGAMATFNPQGKFTWSAPSVTSTPTVTIKPTVTINVPSSPSLRGIHSPPTTLLPIIPVPHSSSGGIYPSTGSGHWIKSVSDNGRVVVLEDDSVWEISELDRSDVSLWLSNDEITVVDNPSNPFYPYKLINTDQGETAEAKLLSR